MIRTFSEKLISDFSEFVERRIGLHFPQARWNDLERGLHLAAHEFGFHDDVSCAEWLLKAPLTKKEIEILASALTVGETYFFREKRSFEILERKILPELVQARKNSDRRLRIWSAGCATGEEPYSIAMVLSRLIPNWKNWNLTLLATDINPRFLEKARLGEYTEWSFRECPAWVRENYFKKKKDKTCKIIPAIREMVTFDYLNLAEDVYPSLLNNTNAMDLIFCRNVLMYFAPHRAQKVIENFYHCLVEGGALVVSACEVSGSLYPRFASVSFPGAIIYRKESGRKKKEEKPEIIFETAVPEKMPEEKMPEEKEPPPPLTLDSESILLLARLHANQGELSQAEKECQQAIAADKLNPRAHFLMANILQEQGKTADAAGALKKVLYLDPHFVLAHFSLGNLAWRQGRIEEARKHFENALGLLEKRAPEEILPESEGVSAGRLMEVIRNIWREEAAA